MRSRRTGLAFQIELARREEQLVAQRGAYARLQAEEAAGASRIDVEAQAIREQRLAEARAEGTRALGEARAAAEAALVAAYRDLPDRRLLGMAARDLAQNLPAIGSLTITPDLLSGLAGALTAGTGTAGRRRRGGREAPTAEAAGADQAGRTGEDRR